jgi:uncharacterized membrane protein
MANTSESIRATFSDFPSLHPLIVHFAIVLLIVGAIIQLFNIYFLKRELAWISFAMITIGVITAYLAGRYFHPHTHGLSEQAKLVLQQHDFWADWTIYLGFSGVILQGTNFFFMKRKRWAVAIVAVILTGSGFAVSQAGHYGAQLVHIEGVGPQGDFLESDKNEHEH